MALFADTGLNFTIFLLVCEPFIAVCKSFYIFMVSVYVALYYDTWILRKFQSSVALCHEIWYMYFGMFQDSFYI